MEQASQWDRALGGFPHDDMRRTDSFWVQGGRESTIKKDVEPSKDTKSGTGGLLVVYESALNSGNGCSGRKRETKEEKVDGQ